MRSFVGSRRVGLAALVAVGIALPSCNLLLPRMAGSRLPSNESVAIACLRAYLGGQNTFHRTDYYGIGKKVYANPKDGVGFPDLDRIGGPGGTAGPIGLIDMAFAQATFGGRPKAGYYFGDLRYTDYSVDCGLCAVPASYNRSGRNIFIIDVTGTVYMKDAAAEYLGIKTGDKVPPLKTYPTAQALTTWIPVGG